MHYDLFFLLQQNLAIAMRKHCFSRKITPWFLLMQFGYYNMTEEYYAFWFCCRSLRLPSTTQSVMFMDIVISSQTWSLKLLRLILFSLFSTPALQVLNLAHQSWMFIFDMCGLDVYLLFQFCCTIFLVNNLNST